MLKEKQSQVDSCVICDYLKSAASPAVAGLSLSHGRTSGILRPNIRGELDPATKEVRSVPQAMMAFKSIQLNSKGERSEWELSATYRRYQRQVLIDVLNFAEKYPEEIQRWANALSVD